MTLGSTNSNRRGKLQLWRIKQLQNSGGESFASSEVEESFDETEELELDQQATTSTTTSATTVRLPPILSKLRYQKVEL